MTRTARGTFQISMKPAESSSAQLGRMTFEKTWAGDLNGQSRGGFALHQYGTLVGGEASLLYEIVPASGSGELAGITGQLGLKVIDQVHHYELKYALPD